MKNIAITFFVVALLVSCSNKPTLQKYFVENIESKDFISIDVGSDIINTDKISLTDEDKEALKSFEKVNVLAFNKGENNKANYEIEVKKVKTILKDTVSYNELMKFGSGNDGAAVYSVGDDDHINEIVLFANKKENGFAVVRVLGKDMNPMNVVRIVTLIQKSSLNMEQLRPLQEIMK